MPSRTLDALDVLTSAGAARDAVSAAVDLDGPALDALLVSDLLRSTGRVGEALHTRAALVELCALVRALDAARARRIGLEDLLVGVRMHATRTDHFAAFHEAGVLLRTVLEVLEHGLGRHDEGPVRSQLAYLHRELRGWLLTQLTGSPDGQVGQPLPTPPAPDPRAPWLLRDGDLRRRCHEFAEDLLHGARDRPVTGLLGAAWVRGWSAVPVPGDLFGEERAAQARLDLALSALDGGRPRRLVQVERALGPRWRLEGTRMSVCPRSRRAWSLPPDPDGIAALAGGDGRGWTIITSERLDFAIVEDAGHHALLAPRPVADVLCGEPVLSAMARFRDYVEALEVDGEPPADLLEVAERFGRYRRRAR